MLRFGPAAALIFVVLAGPAMTQAPDWPTEKCQRYSRAWDDALRRTGGKGLGEAFQEAHSAFLAGGCSGLREVCPRTRAELEMANTLTMLALNAGMSGTFLPFKCRPRS
ncbi:MAG: hypothetical protein J0L51_06850 [Rhizobiales bacterium]|nr:hypothetical protein [Hyphomicrobiales bacterium]